MRRSAAADGIGRVSGLSCAGGLLTCCVASEEGHLKQYYAPVGARSDGSHCCACVVYVHPSTAAASIATIHSECAGHARTPLGTTETPALPPARTTHARRRSGGNENPSDSRGVLTRGTKRFGHRCADKETYPRTFQRSVLRCTLQHTCVAFGS